MAVNPSPNAETLESQPVGRILTVRPLLTLAGAGVRLSPCAAKFASRGVRGFSNILGKSEIAAPGDERTPVVFRAGQIKVSNCGVAR